MHEEKIKMKSYPYFYNPGFRRLRGKFMACEQPQSSEKQ